MAIPFYLALTGAEFHSCRKLPDKIAWMACHFSPYGTGQSNLPQKLPEGALLILNDRTPIHGHDPQRILDQIREVILAFKCHALLIDFQRPRCDAAVDVVQALATLPCPVAVSSPYIDGSNCAIFVPPVPLLTPVGDHLVQWAGRDIWLDIAAERLQIRLTEDGSAVHPLYTPDLPECPLQDPQLHCHYRIDLADHRADFTLQRTKDDLQDLLEDARSHGATHAVGLYQEFNEW